MNHLRRYQKKEYKTLLNIVNNLHKNEITIIFISHRLDELYEIGETVSVLKDGKNVFTGELKGLDINNLVKYMIGHTIINQRSIVNPEYIKNDIILKLSNVSTNKLKNLSFEVKRGEIRGIYGLVGSGRSEILHAIYGVDSIVSGDLIIKNIRFKNTKPSEAIKAGVGLLPEDRKVKGVVLNLPVWEKYYYGRY